MVETKTEAGLTVKTYFVAHFSLGVPGISEVPARIQMKPGANKDALKMELAEAVVAKYPMIERLTLLSTGTEEVYVTAAGDPQSNGTPTVG